MKNSVLVQTFIEQIWNKKSFQLLDNLLHPAFKDHSLSPILSPDKEGLIKWITATGISFEHTTTIEDHVSERDQVMLRIKMKLRHIGNWRGIEPTGIELSTSGYRHFKIKDERIIEHWALIDGENIANMLKKASHGCAVTA
ncbi:ester cyclase [Pollutibacter soli]|uniref:ester cyclase n=1 Tax=Pollutibacter soli TaxID=3034157 RepID=UPI0030134ADD